MLQVIHSARGHLLHVRLAAILMNLASVLDRGLVLRLLLLHSRWRVIRYERPLSLRDQLLLLLESLLVGLRGVLLRLSLGLGGAKIDFDFARLALTVLLGTVNLPIHLGHHHSLLLLCLG